MDKKWQVFFLVAVSIFMSTLDSSIVNVALPYMMQALSEDMESIQWVVTAYLVTVSSLLLTFGRLSDIRGRSFVYRSGFVFFTLGSFLCGISGNVAFLVMARVIQGMGASMLMACSPALVVDVFEPAHRGRVLGLVGACVAAGLTAGPLAGGILLEYFSWRSIFFINIPVGVAALMYAGTVLRDKVCGCGESMDMAGSLLVIILISSLIIGLTNAGEWGLGSVRTILCWTIGVLSGVGFAVNARKVRYPLFDLGLFKIRRFILPLAASLVLFAALFSLIFMMPFYLSLACGLSPARTGLVMIVPFLFLLLVSPVAGALSDRFGSRILCGTGMFCLALALVLLGQLSPAQEMPGILWRLALAGVGTSLFISPNSRVVMGAVPADRRGIASGAVATARNLGMVLGVALSSAVFTHSFTVLTQGRGLDRYAPEMAPFFMAGFRDAMAAGAVIAGLGIVVTLARGSETIQTEKGESL